MKKILLATTILGMTAGFAAAEVSFKGTGTVGFASDGGDPTDFYSSFKLSVAGSGETDSGLTFGASTSLTTGTTYTFADDDSFDYTNDGAFGEPTLFVAGEFGKIEFKNDGFKEFQSDDSDFENYDLNYAGTFGGLKLGLRTDLNANVGNTDYVAATAGKSSISLGYTISDIALSAAYDQRGDAWGISAGRAFGPVTATLGAASDVDGVQTQSLTLAYAADALSASLKASTDDTWKVVAGYTANGLTIGAQTTDASKWEVKAGYDLGGGLSVEAGTNYTNDMFVGAKMAF